MREPYNVTLKWRRGDNVMDEHGFGVSCPTIVGRHMHPRSRPASQPINTPAEFRPFPVSDKHADGTNNVA